MKGLVGTLVIQPFKFLFTTTAIVYVIAGAAAAAAFAYFVFSVVGMTLGFTVGGAPVIIEKYHQGQAQIEKYAASKGSNTKLPNAQAQGGN